MSGQLAFETLLEIAERSQASAKGLPAQLDLKQNWSGVGFSLFGQRYVAPMGEVAEMLEMMDFTLLPGVTSWIKGVANVRGRLLPLTDLADFLGGALQTNRRQQRILVVEVDEVYCGLVVDTVYGMQHFPVDNYTPDVTGGVINEEVSRYLQGTFVSDGDSGDKWTVFSPWELVRSDKFYKAALI
jgi:twitching motility protein PilI